MKKVIYLIPNIASFLFFLLVISCNTDANKKNEIKQKYLTKIDSLENRLKQSSSIDIMALEGLMANYASYATNFPEDSIAANYLFKAGEIATSLKKPQQAINYFNTICEKYTSYKKLHYAYFMQAFIYENQMQNIDKAKEYYTIVINKFPQQQIASDAKICIQNLGKSDEEIIKEFEKKNNI